MTPPQTCQELVNKRGLQKRAKGSDANGEKEKPRLRQSGSVTRTQSKDGAGGLRVGTCLADSTLLVTQG